MAEIKIATEFSKTPGGRYRKDGVFSGEEFYETKLKIAFEKLSPGEKLRIDFDNTYGYPPSFVSEAFGRLYKECGGEEIREKLELISESDKSLIDIIYQRAKEYV